MVIIPFLVALQGRIGPTCLSFMDGVNSRDKPSCVRRRANNSSTFNYTELLHSPACEGAIVDGTGENLGRHSGFWQFTPGQRKGLGVAAEKPLYVLRVDAKRNELVVGSYEESLTQSCLLEDVHLHAPLAEGERLEAQIRSSQKPFIVEILPETPEGLLAVHFAEAQQGVAPGQSLVLYRGDVVTGGGFIY